MAVKTAIIFLQQTADIVALIKLQNSAAGNMIGKQMGIFAVGCKHIIMIGNAHLGSDLFCRF